MFGASTIISCSIGRKPVHNRDDRQLLRHGTPDRADDCQVLSRAQLTPSTETGSRLFGIVIAGREPDLSYSHLWQEGNPMVKNMGTADRVVRVLLAIVVGILYFMGTISGAAAVILGIVALAFLVTSMIGYCPAYAPLGVNTAGRK
jgi:hypothetical protein